MMKRMVRFSLLSLVLFPVFAGPVRGQNEFVDSLRAAAVIEQKVMMPMRDGVRLATDIYRPKTKKPVPIIFSRTPYNFNLWRDGKFQSRGMRSAWEAVKRGYAYVVQNERGRYYSEGEWDILGTPRTDGYDAFSWMADQTWSNGKIGTLGCSSTAEWQMGVAALDHPAHAAMVPMGFGAGVGRVGSFYEQGNWYRGGAEQMLFFAWLYGVQNGQRPMFPKGMSQEDLVRVSRYYDLAPEMPRVDWDEGLKHLPLVDILKNVEGPKGIYEKMIKRTPNDPSWYEGGLYHDDMPFGVPSLWFMSWYDVSISPNLALFNYVRHNADDPEVAKNQYAVIAPTTHCGYFRTKNPTIVGDRDVGDARFDYNDLIYGWFDYWLKGERNGIPENTPHVQYYTMGANQWNASSTWPPTGTQTETWYLGSDGHANTSSGDGVLTSSRPGRSDAPDAFSYDPADPVPSHGGNVCCTGNAVRAGSLDQQEMEQRDDILVYTSDPFENGIEISGNIVPVLYVSSDARDTDITVKLIDVYPDGRAYNLDETIQRLRYREGYEKPVFMEPGKVYEVTLSALSTSNFFAPGHRIRIEVSGSNFPRFTRNMNTGGRNWNESVGVVAHTKVHHSRTYPSRLEISVMHR